MSFRILIDTDNDAFHPIDSSFPLAEADELCDLLTAVCARLRRGDRTGTLRDTNGNTVGTFDLS